MNFRTIFILKIVISGKIQGWTKQIEGLKAVFLEIQINICYH